MIQGYLDKKCIISNPFIAKKLRCTTRTVQRSLKELKDAGFIGSSFKKNAEGMVVERVLYTLTAKKSKKQDDGWR